MSSYYTTADLEAMRKARIKQELAAIIQKTKEQLETEHTNTAQLTAGTNVEMSVFYEDDTVSGFSQNEKIKDKMILSKNNSVRADREALDFSEMISLEKKPTKMEKELYSWFDKIYERPILSEEDEKDRTRVIAEFAKIIHDTKTDVEDKIKSVKMRVISYLQRAATITDHDKDKINSDYYEYCALCKMLNVEAKEKIPYRVEKEISRMISVLEKRKQDEYIMGVIGEIMEELGCEVKDEAVLEHTPGSIYSVAGLPLCDVFVGTDGKGIMFEAVGESKAVSLEKQRQIESSANSICDMYSNIEERAAEKGVILKKVYIEPARVKNMCVKSDIKEKADKKNRKRNNVKIQKTNSEY